MGGCLIIRILSPSPARPSTWPFLSMASLTFQQQEDEKEKDDSESTDMELEDFGLEEVSTPSGAAAGESRGTGRPKGIKAAASPASPIVKRKVRGMLAAQRLLQQELKMKQQKLQQLKQQKEQQELLRQVCVIRHPRLRAIYFSRSTGSLSGLSFRISHVSYLSSVSLGDIVADRISTSHFCETRKFRGGGVHFISSRRATAGAPWWQAARRPLRPLPPPLPDSLRCSRPLHLLQPRHLPQGPVSTGLLTLAQCQVQA